MNILATDHYGGPSNWLSASSHTGFNVLWISHKINWNSRMYDHQFSESNVWSSVYGQNYFVIINILFY